MGLRGDGYFGTGDCRLTQTMAIGADVRPITQRADNKVTTARLRTLAGMMAIREKFSACARQSALLHGRVDDDCEGAEDCWWIVRSRWGRRGRDRHVRVHLPAAVWAGAGGDVVPNATRSVIPISPWPPVTGGLETYGGAPWSTIRTVRRSSAGRIWISHGLGGMFEGVGQGFLDDPQRERVQFAGLAVGDVYLEPGVLGRAHQFVEREWVASSGSATSAARRESSFSAWVPARSIASSTSRARSGRSLATRRPAVDWMTIRLTA